LKDAIECVITEDEWRSTDKQSGRQPEELVRMVEPFDLDVNVYDFPRTCRQ
jgi:hypothetical protein